MAVQAKIDKDWLVESYVKERKNSRELAEEVGVSQPTILRHLRKYGVEIRGREDKMKASARKLLEDKEWLTKKYVNQKMSSIKIGEEIGCSAKKVLDALHEHKIEKRSAGHHVNKDAIAKLENKEWLYTEYAINGRSAKNIAEELGVGDALVARTVRNYGFLVSGILDEETKVKLENREWLEKQYTLGKTSYDIASELGVSKTSVLIKLKSFGISVNKGGVKLPVEAQVLQDKAWLYNKYVSEEKTVFEISEETKASTSAVLSWLKKHGLPIRKSCLSLEAQMKLEDKEWLESEYSVKGRRITDIADELGCIHGTVNNRLKAFGIERTGMLDKETFERLNDICWLEEAYKEFGSVKVLSEHLGCSTGAVYAALKKAGIDVPERKLLSEEVKSKLADKIWLENEYKTKSIADIAFDLGCSETTVSNCFDVHEIKKVAGSAMERSLASFVQSLGVETVLGSRKVIFPLELDVYCPELKIGIELNGLFWHAEAVDGHQYGRHKNYHKDKYDVCVEKGIELIQIWEDQWRDKPEVVKNFLKFKLGKLEEVSFDVLGAEVVELSYVSSKLFLDVYHIDGGCKGSLYLGLENEGVMVAVMVLQRSSDGVWFLRRYAAIHSVDVCFGVLLDYFKCTQSWVKVVGVVDLCFPDVCFYEFNGFVCEKMLLPDYMYAGSVNGWVRESKSAYSVLRFYSDSCLQWVEGLSKGQLVELNGLYKIWDAGKSQWVLENC